MLRRLFLVAVLAGVLNQPWTAAAQSGAPTSGGPSVAVSTTPARTARMVERVTAYGNLVARRSVNIVPDRAGQVEKILFADGQEVAAGTPLVRMDSRIAEAQLEASRAQAEANLQNLKRTQSLHRQGLDSTYSVEQAQSRAAASQADLAINQRKLDELVLRAPFAGTLGTRRVDVGAFLNGDETIVRLDDASQLQVEFRIPSSVALRVSEKTPVHIAVPSDERLPVSGALSFIDPVVSTDTRSVLLRAVVRNPDRRLRPGLFVRVTLDVGVHPEALVVPEAAVTRELGGAYVFVVDEHNIARRRNVGLGLSQDGLVELTSGVKPGEQVVTVGQFRLQGGDRVKVVPAAETESSG